MMSSGENKQNYQKGKRIKAHYMAQLNSISIITHVRACMCVVFICIYKTKQKLEPYGVDEGGEVEGVVQVLWSYFNFPQKEVYG